MGKTKFETKFDLKVRVVAVSDELEKCGGDARVQHGLHRGLALVREHAQEARHGLEPLARIGTQHTRRTELHHRVYLKVNSQLKGKSTTCVFDFKTQITFTDATSGFLELSLSADKK